MANDNNKSDYNEPFMDLLRYLPEPFQSDVNISLFSNLFNRFLTKKEVRAVAGYIGEGNTNAIVSRQIQENDVHRQAFQLQPLIYNKIGSIEHITSWQDILAELTRLGVNINNLPTWGAVQTFNWAPPIDINKIINFRDYYWVDGNNSLPQYITIRSRCGVATSLSNFWTELITQYGSLFPIIDIAEIDDITSLLTFDINTIDTGTGEINISGDATEVLLNAQFFDVINTLSNNAVYAITIPPTYDGVSNSTTLTVAGLVANEAIGQVRQRKFDKIVLGANATVPSGDYADLFADGFVFFMQNTGNPELNNRFIRTLSSTFDADNNQTIVTIDLVVTDDTNTSAMASLLEQNAIYIDDRNCQCNASTTGWDSGVLWDDNPEIPLLGDVEGPLGSPMPDGISDLQNLLDRISNIVPPTIPGIPNELWFDTVGDILYQYNTTTGWKVIWNSFSILLGTLTGTVVWDQSPLCNTLSRIEATDQWIDQNSWLHKNDITNFAGAIRAIQPIVEYTWDLELNEWTFTNYRWGYRSESLNTFVETTIKPTIIELEELSWWELDITDVTNRTIILDARYGDQTDCFTENSIYDINNIPHTVNFSEYKELPGVNQYRTFIVFTTGIVGSTGDLNMQRPNSILISPVSTKQGDAWGGYGVHWLLLGSDNVVPVSHQSVNPYIPIDEGGAGIIFGAPPEYEFRTSAFTQTYQLLAPTVSVLELIDDVAVAGSPAVVVDTVSLRRKALFGFDDIRVYLSDIANENIVRQFGTFEEIGEVVLDIIGIDYANNEFIIGSEFSTFFTSGDIIRVRSNDVLGTFDFTVDAVPPSNTNRIKVTTNLTPILLSATGEISNITAPLSTDTYPTANFVNDATTTIYVMGIRFMTPVAGGQSVTIEVAEAGINEIGARYNRVRTIEDQEQYNIIGDISISRIQYRKVEQIKTSTNQYPLFDIFTVDGNDANVVNPIFGYKTSPESPINQTGLRIVFDQTTNIFEFDQFILNEDNGELFAFRDYSNQQNDFWYNPETKILQFWKGIEWDDKTVMSEHYRRAVVSVIEPSIRERAINNLYWFNPAINTLFIRLINPTTMVGIWVEVPGVDIGISDVSLQTIWKAGLNDEQYIPDMVDWRGRSLIEYNTEMAAFVDSRIIELLANGDASNETEATTLASTNWFISQINNTSPTGIWIGDWEIPDPLYHNNLHENRKCLTSRELLSHFASIIEEQPRIPGYRGLKNSMFNLIPSNSVNYGVGGTIKEFNGSFDTFLSSVFVNNVTPRTLIEFANNQYEALLNSIQEIYRRNAIALLTNVEPNNILGLSMFVANEVIRLYELNDQNALIYGDSTTFTDIDGVNDLGVRNWIATLPYLGLLAKQTPLRTINEQLNLNEVVHHDGHREEYTLTSATIDIISQLVISTPDERTASDTMGRGSINQPPNNIVEFSTEFSTNIGNREGVYWYHRPTTGAAKLYRYTVVESGNSIPVVNYPDGTLWMDLNIGVEVLRVKNTDVMGIITWDIVSGLALGDGRLHNGTTISDLDTSTISAWQEVDISILLGDTIFELENRLFSNVPDFTEIVYDFTSLQTANPVEFQQNLEEAFLDYVSQNNIVTPYLNSEFTAVDPFTWNYKRAATGGGINILEADGLTNSFLVAGNQLSFFDPCANSATASPVMFPACVVGGTIITFYIKNSDSNNGTWSTLSSTVNNFTAFYDIGANTTRVFVQDDVVLSLNSGIIYFGNLPSIITTSTPTNLNDGSESGGDWKDVYNKIYNTPYPNLEPWNLQGYLDKPTWWDAEYLNVDPDQWGVRRWNYKHGFEITTILNTNNDSIDGIHGTFGFAGNFNDLLITGHTFFVDGSNGSPNNDGIYIIAGRDVITGVVVGAAGSAAITIDDSLNLATAIYLPNMVFSIIQTPIVPASNNTITKTFTIQNVSKIGSVFTISVLEEIIVGDVIPTTSTINGTLYDSVSNTTTIKIAGITTTTSISGRLVKSDGFGFGMWENIRIGIIPAGQPYPNGVLSITGNPTIDNINGLSVPELPKFSYFSTNISNVTVSADSGATNYNADDIFPPFWAHTVVFGLITTTIDVAVRTLYSDFSTEIIAPQADYVFGDAGPTEIEWRLSSQFLYDQSTIAYRIDPINYIDATFGVTFFNVGGLNIDRFTKNTPSHTRVNFHGDVVNNAQFTSNGLNQWYVNFNRFAGFDSNFADFSELWSGWTAPLTYQFASFVDTPSLSVAHRFVPITEFDFNITSKRTPGAQDFWLDAFDVSIINTPRSIIEYDNQSEWRFELKTNASISRNIKFFDVQNYQFYADPVTNICTLYTWVIDNIDTFDKSFGVIGDQTYVFTQNSEFDITGSTSNNNTYTVLRSVYDLITDTTTIFVSNTIPSPILDGVITADYRSFNWVTGDSIYLTTTQTLPIPLLGDNVNGLTRYFIIRISNTVFSIANTPQDAITATPITITSAGVRDAFVGEIVNTFDAGINTLSNNNSWRTYALDKGTILEFNTPFQVQGVQSLINIIHGYESYSIDIGWAINDDKTLQSQETNQLISWQSEVEEFISYIYSRRFIRQQVSDSYSVSVNETTDIWTFLETNRSFITGDVVTVTSTGSFPVPLSSNIRYYIIRDTLTEFRLAASPQDAANNINIDITSTVGVSGLRLSLPSTLQTTIPNFEINPFRNSIWFNTPTGIVSNIITGPVEDIRTSQLIFDQDGNRISVDNLRVYRQDQQTKIQILDLPTTPGNELIFDNNSGQLNLGGLHLFTDAYEHVLIFNNYTTDNNLLYDPFIGLNVTKYELSFNKQPEFIQRPSVGGYTIETFFNQGTNLIENMEAGVENLRFAYDTYNTTESNLMTQHSRRGLGYAGPEEFLLNLNLSEKSQFIFWRGQIQNKGTQTAISAFTNSRRFIDASVDEYWAIKVGEFGSVEEKEYPELFVTTTDARSNELRLEFITNDALDSSVEETFTPIKLSDQDRWYDQPDQVDILSNNGSIMFFDAKAKNNGTFIISGVGDERVMNNGLSYIIHNLDSDSVEITQLNTATLLHEVLVETTHYNVINNNIIQFIASISASPEIMIWGLVVNDDAQSPARLIDRLSETQLGPIQFWDPARGIHYSNAIANIDIQNQIDPAQYSDTPLTIVNETLWMDTFVGSTWWNTENLDYVPYFSKEMLPDTTNRFRNWGQLADWSSIDIFEWVESDVPPAEWDIIALQEEGDITIPEHLRKSGMAKLTLFEDNAGTWIPAVNKVVEQYVVTEALTIGLNYVFTIPVVDFTMSGSPLTYIVDVYVNGKLFATQQDIFAGVYSIPTALIKQADIVRFIQEIPTDQSVIDAGVAAGQLLQEHEFTQISVINDLNVSSNTYYFWVRNKGTRPINRNRTLSISEAQVQLGSIPAPHMFFQELLIPETVTTEDIIIQRSESYIAGGSPIGLVFTVNFPVATGTSIIVEVNGADLANDGTAFILGGSPETITIINPLPGGGNLSAGDVVKITYSGVDNKPITLPHRYTQAVIRGLQGIVNADRRYTVRFTRNFTLRDTLDVQNVDIDSVELKSLHEEWKIFRQDQQNNIDRFMWDKITESIVGYTLNDSLVRVPSFNKELYDQQFNTQTQYGLEEGQAFVSGTLALSTILAYLTDPNNDFTPIDINLFFIENSFDTPENIISAMNNIYNTFLFGDVNRMYFSVLHDAFTTKIQYPGIFKTSMLSLHGVQPFVVNGLFDT